MIFFIFLIIWVACAFFSSNVAKAKGYSSSSWFFAGFFFGIFALIAAAGLPDKKLRHYLLRIGVKQEAIKRASLQEEEEQEVYGNQPIKFLTAEKAKEEEIYKILLSNIDDEVRKEKLMRKCQSRDIEKGFAEGSFEFGCKDKDENYLLVLKGKKVEDNQIEWSGNL